LRLSVGEHRHPPGSSPNTLLTPTPKFRYQWTTGDVGFWDNRVTQHSVVGDFGEKHRVIQRVTIRGDEPV
jgi:alpha-ketoglutarate-dependent taurine dioxygenase